MTGNNLKVFFFNLQAQMFIYLHRKKEIDELVMEAVERRPQVEDDADQVKKEEVKPKEEVKEPAPKKTKPIKSDECKS